MDENNKRHISEKDAWLVEKKAMEAKFNQDLQARDTNLANREAEFARKLAEITATHDAFMKQSRADHEAAMAARLADHHAAQNRFDAELHAQQQAIVVLS